jgi:hypothetical protein
LGKPHQSIQERVDILACHDGQKVTVIGGEAHEDFVGKFR